MAFGCMNSVAQYRPEAVNHDDLIYYQYSYVSLGRSTAGER